MRLIAIILAIMVFFLSCLPCADVDALPLANVKTEMSKKSSHEHKSEHKDECSPFCHCSCCATFCVIKVPLIFQFTPKEHIARVYTVHFAEEVHEISLPVWQPPQLV